MEEIQGHDNPLFRRFSDSIFLKQMDYHDPSSFYPSFSLEDKVRLYAAFGGVPYYNVQIDENQSVKENIIRILSRDIFPSLRIKRIEKDKQCQRCL